MKKTWVILIAIVCLATIVAGRFYWNYKIDQAVHAQAIENQDGDTKDSDSASDPDVKKQIEKLPEPMRDAANAAEQENGQVQIAMVGSENVQALSLLLQDRLDKTFGDLFFKVTPVDVKKMTSLQVNEQDVEKLFQTINGGPDVVIYTPLVYNDDHKVSTEDTQTVSGLFEQKVIMAYPDSVFMLSPPNYSSEQDYINERIDAFEDFSKDQEITYLNYLSEWPDDSERDDVVGSDGHTMNKSGQQIWIDYVAKEWGLSD